MLILTRLVFAVYILAAVTECCLHGTCGDMPTEHFSFLQQARAKLGVAKNLHSLGILQHHQMVADDLTNFRVLSVQQHARNLVMWPKAKGQGCPQQGSKDTFKSVVLAVMWNFAVNLTVASELDNAYKPWFADVLHIGGESPCNFQMKGDYMYSCYAETMAKYSGHGEVTGVLFIADDVVFRPWDLASLGLHDLNKAWLPGWNFTSFKWESDAVDDPWVGRWAATNAHGEAPSGAYDALHVLFSERSDLQMQLDQNLGCSTHCLPAHKVTDVLFLPLVHAPQFIDFAQVFRSHAVFTEAAVPIILSLLGQPTEIAQDMNNNDTNLWTWDQDRGTTTADDVIMNLMVANPEQSLMMHPVKMSEPGVLDTWRTWFSRAGPCSEMTDVEKLLDSIQPQQSSVQQTVRQIVDIIKPSLVSPLSFRGSPSAVMLGPPPTARVQHMLHEPLPKACRGARFWAVLTTVHPVGEGIRRLDRLPGGWCTLVVADKKTPRDADGAYFRGAKRVFYLSPEEQERLPFATTAHIPWNSFVRKNIGYLVASALGAETIYDTDDDNILADKSLPPLLHNDSQNLFVRQLTTESGGVTNIYAHFGSTAPEVWPRGTPLHIAMTTTSSNTTQSIVASESLVIQQSLVNGDPDVDAIYRLGAGISEGGIKFESDMPLVLEPGVSAPTNSQATTFHQKAFPLMLLPASVHPRVSDIWRSYFALPILWAKNLRVAYVAPRVEQVRNKHDEKEDLWAEWPLYHKAGSLAAYVNILNVDPSISIPEAMLQMYEEMHMKGFIEVSDLQLCKAFMEDVQLISMLDVSYPI
eukprot:gnl/TRDRNA2_/TRDRNA2_154481_c0_seq1.p1 gnl/TRDRNA2_/TRDRNA2_154481_c0~~gnl/TRDRNA2_/TRDRNA2_154481_c0_seq1.p1  ORF type:complete len:807 (+),score=93.45 gnl/TRDRNA2_/TRDRNA2_154481_c0_seq1:105-2525(+)